MAVFHEPYMAIYLAENVFLAIFTLIQIMQIGCFIYAF